MRLAALLSGGKDSMYSMYKCMQEGHEIRYIISFISENPDSYMFHTPNIDLVKEQAKLLGIKHIEIPTKGEKEKELDDIEAALKSIAIEIDGIVTGATASTYQKSRIDAICERLGIKSLAPLWQLPPEETLRNMINEKFEIFIVTVAAPPLDQEWVGRKVTHEVVDDLVKLNKNHGIHILFEGGEAESFVTDCPMFPKKIKIVESEKVWNNKLKHGILNIKKIKLIEK
ncbi:MAG: TIGR00289 family protein [Candidatus Aenigmarchaeota archaeon]|nr:TIGR00289 family protein [Candidatus Aenigmarchaeota archaeon]